ncbi:juvenile hormone esterase isoform X2 [Leptinotarsa decemlineata]|uniref:juvenile hormone esterase isoform X2 n=1 Tax=Leptinotarsa decemlineata TaxID=7539 RepID=UPI003D304C01
MHPKIFLLFASLATILQKSPANIENDQSEGDPIVTIEDGKIRGRHDETVDLKKPYITFQGIPYAKPPLGNLRFSPPEKNSNWSGILDATKEKPECVQGTLDITGSEDCLYINVYTTSLTQKKAVMVFIYGGSFVLGNSSYSQYPPDWLLEADVVYASFNYRVGVFGFISTLDEVAPGNIGLKDQCLALKWVKHNIDRFGGDPNRITIFGESAGSASVSYQLQSTCARGAYNRAILQSGTSLCLWALHRRAKRTAHDIARFFHVDSWNTSKILEGLRKVDYKTLQQVSIGIASRIALENPLAGIQFGPVIEPYHNGAFFYNYSEKGLSEGYFDHVPTIIGVNSNEGAATGSIPALIRLYLLKYDIQFELLAPEDLTKYLLDRRIAALAIKTRYFNIFPLSIQTESVIKFISDDQFNRPVLRTAGNMAKYSPVYFYVFSYEGRLGGVEQRTVPGVRHTEDLGYIFRGFPTRINNISESDKLTSNRIIKLWTNFAKYGNPTHQNDSVLQNVIWPLSSSISNSLVYLNISANLEIGINPFHDNMKFYEKEIYGKYGQPPYDTY